MSVDLSTLRGRALDVEVAETVMGWTDVSQDHQWNYVRGHSIWFVNGYDGEREWNGLPPGAAPRDYQRVPNFSTDIGAAWDVVEPWPNANYLMLACLGAGINGGWAAAFSCVEDVDGLPWHEHPEVFGGVKAATPGEAICLAAIAAVCATA
jgi:hypothetical protein